MTGTVRRILTSMAFAVGLTGVAQAQQPLALATLPQGSLGYAIAAAISKVVSEETDLDMRAVGQGGSNVFLPQVNSGEIAFGTSNTFESVFAVTGTGNFDGRPNADLRAAALLVPFTVGFMVPADSDIQTIEDLRGQDVASGYARQELVGIIQDAVFEAIGVSPDEYSPVPVANFVEGANLLAQGDVDAVLLSPGSGVVQQTHAQRPVRFLSIPDGPAIADAIAASLPGATLARVEPVERMPEIVEAVNLVGYQYALLANKDVAEDTVYTLVKGLHENKDALAQSHGIFNGFQPDQMANPLQDVTYHAGAERYYREAGIWPAQ